MCVLVLHLKCRGPDRALGDCSAPDAACEMLRRPSEEMLTRICEGLAARPLCLSRLSGEPGSDVPAESQMEGPFWSVRMLLLPRMTTAPAW